MPQATAFGGEAAPGNVAVTEQYNGTNWTEVNDLNTAAVMLGSHGTVNSTMAALGQAPSVSTLTEKWNSPASITRTFTDS